VYEEAHKYVPNSELLKYRSSKKSIKRIAKEGRKYGVALLLASQRPPPTIFLTGNYGRTMEGAESGRIEGGVVEVGECLMQGK
jgi:hypothetical protein